MTNSDRGILQRLPNRVAAIVGTASLLVAVTVGIDNVVARVVADETLPTLLTDAIRIVHGVLVLGVIVIVSILTIIGFIELLVWLYRGKQIGF